MVTKHNEDESRKVKCIKCDSKVVDLSKHIRRCFSEEDAANWEFKCSVCYNAGKWRESLCSNANHLGHHLIQHTDEARLVHCPVNDCKKKFVKQTHLDYHLARMHRSAAIAAGLLER